VNTYYVILGQPNDPRKSLSGFKHQEVDRATEASKAVALTNKYRKAHKSYVFWIDEIVTEE